MMPKWFRGNACREVCQTNLVCPPEALGSACGLMSNDLLPLGSKLEIASRANFVTWEHDPIQLFCRKVMLMIDVLGKLEDLFHMVVDFFLLHIA